MIYSLHRFGASFEEYFIYKFYNLNALGRSKFNTLKMQYGYCELVNGNNVRSLFEDKGACYNLFKDFYKRDFLKVNNADDIPQLKDFITKHPSFIFKPVFGHSGMGVKIYRKLTPDDHSIAELMKQGENQFVVEELIEQVGNMAKMHPESINTIRIATFTANGKVNVLGSALRMGTGKSNVDNAGAGGIYAGVDAKEGVVISIARDNVGNTFLRHPDSQIVIPGFVIPEWDKLLTVTSQMARTVTDATVIAWDLAYSSKGWVMVEGNDVGEQYLLQAPLQKGVKFQLQKHIDAFMLHDKN